jgi:hypothetical protein
MTRKSRLVQVLRFVSIAALVLVVLSVSLVQVRQHLFRHRAKLLLDDMRDLWMHPGTFDDLRHLELRWGAFGHYDGTCTIEHCEYTITLTNLELSRSENDRLRFLKFITFALLGGRDVDIMCGIVVHNNQMALESVWFMIEAPHGKGGYLPFGYAGEDIMQVRIHSASRLFSGGVIGREADLKRQYEIVLAHPGTSALVHITPQTSVADIKRITDINLDCITRIKPCVDMDDLLPEAWLEFRREHNGFDPSAYATRCSVDPALFAREAENIALVEVLKLHAAEYPSEERTQGATVRILESLKNNIGHPVGSIADISFGGQNVYVGPGALSDPNRRLAVGDRVFLLYPPLVPGQSTELIDTGSCSLIPLSDTTFRSVREGISMDRSNNGLHDISVPY